MRINEVTKKNCGCNQDPCVTYGEQKESKEKKPDDFKPHYMYKGTKKDYKAKLTTKKGDHGRLDKRGYSHDDPETKKIEEVTLEDTQDFHEEYGYLGYSVDDNDLFEAEYQGRKVKLNKPMRGDVKKFKVYVKNPKGNVIKVNFGHGGTSAKRPTMRIRKSNPKARKSFRARHNCDNPGPKTKARYWSCRKW